MQEKLFYINENEEVIEFSALSLYHANVAKISGLSDIKNTLYTTASMGQDGETVTGNKIQKRSIVVTGAIKSTNKDVILAAKRQLSHVLNPHLKAKLVYEYNGERRLINCRLETAPIYKRGNALLTFEVDIICAYPFWQDENETQTNIAGFLGNFEFDLNGGGLQIPSNGLELGIGSSEIVVAVINNGDISTGLRAEFIAQGTVTNPKLTNVATAEFMQFNGLTMVAGDTLVVTTEYGKKACKLHHNGEEINALQYWNIDGTFLQLDIGSNYFQFTADTNPDRLTVNVYSTNQYLGV